MTQQQQQEVKANNKITGVMLPITTISCSCSIGASVSPPFVTVMIPSLNW